VTWARSAQVFAGVDPLVELDDSDDFDDFDEEVDEAPEVESVEPDEDPEPDAFFVSDLVLAGSVAVVLPRLSVR